MGNELITKGTEVSVLVPKIWSTFFYKVLLAELPFRDIISSDYQGDANKLGDTVYVNTIPEFEEGDEFGEGDAVDADSVVATQQSLLINIAIAKDFIVTDRASLQSIAFVDQLKEMATYAIMKKINSKIIALAIASTTAPDHTIAYDSGTTLGLADILEVSELLDTQNVPKADRHAVMGAAQWNDIFNITGFMSSDFVAGANSLQSGDVPARLMGFMPHMTTTVGNTSYWFHKSFMTIASQKGMTTKEYDLGSQGIRAQRVNNDTLLGIKLLDNTRIVTLS